jgi:hypothetical protein
MSLKAVKRGLSDQEMILSSTRKEISLPLTNKKLKSLFEVIDKMVQAQNFFLEQFSGIRSVEIANNPKSLRDRYVKEGLPSPILKLGLQARQWKLALDKAFETISSARALTENKVLQSCRKSKLSESSYQMVNLLLKQSRILQLILNGKKVEAQILLRGLNRERPNTVSESDQNFHGCPV